MYFHFGASSKVQDDQKILAENQFAGSHVKAMALHELLFYFATQTHIHILFAALSKLSLN